MGFNSIGLVGGGVKSKLRGLGTLFLVAVLLMGLVTGCPAPTDDEPVVETPVFPLTVTDQVGRVITLEAEPQKIISLVPSSTEIVFALGLGDELVGVTEFCNYPPEALDKPKVAGFSAVGIDVDIEKIVEIQPDLILATETHLTEVIPKIEQLIPGAAIIVLKTQTETLEEVLEAITLIGEVTGKEDEASELVDGMRSRIKAITDKTDNLSDAEKPVVLYIVWGDPIFVIAGGTLGNALIEAAGGINIFQDLTGSPIVSLETIIERNPQVILGSAAIGTGGDLPYQFALTEPRLEGVDARVNSRVYGVNDDLTGRPGPRMVDGLEMLAGLLHPELFPELFDKYFGSD